MKENLKYIIITILFLLIVLALLFIPIGNNIILKKHTNELKNFKLNATYEVVASDDECGKLVGNGNGMQYFSALLIKSKDNLLLDDKCEGVFLIKVSDTSFKDFINAYDYGDYCINIKKNLKKIYNTEYYYVIYSFYNAPLDSIWNFDLRAH